MVSIIFQYPPELARNPVIKQAIDNAALFVRDLWLARAPYASGEYAKGLSRQSSVSTSGGKIEIKNFAKHAHVVEFGFSSYNLGMRILNSGKGVKRSADGFRYKLIKIEPSSTGRHRQASVGDRLAKSFAKTFPGMPISKISRMGKQKQYQARRSLQRPLKGGSPKHGGPQGFYVISERTIRLNPSRWMMPKREGRNLAREVQKEARPLVMQAIRKAVTQEKQRRSSMRGRAPGWSSVAMNSLRTVPPVRVRR